jgi:predicted ATPase/transcriptional regulator with XRE-family HTH domain
MAPERPDRRAAPLAAQPGTFAEVLRRFRLAAGLSQEVLAERAGISVRGLSDLERGLSRAPRLHTLAQLADALRLDAAARQTLTVASGYPTIDDRRTASAFIALAAPAPAQHTLPGYLTGLLGRERDVNAVCELVRRPSVRALTLTGPGGVGKTRLAVQAAEELTDLFPDGVAFVPLAPLRDAALIPAAIAQVLGIGETGDLPLFESLASALRAQRLLLVLDNYEHLLSGATLVADLLERCPSLKVLCTSRTRLRLRGEHAFPVQPLPVPERGQVVDPDAAALWPAVVLFVERAQAVQPAFRLTLDNVDAVVSICSRLDGLPLALELAAARVTILPPPALLERLEHRLPLLTGGPRDAPERHQALRDAIAWSYDLLSASEQRLFRRLSAFAGGWTLLLAQEVCADSAADAESVVADLMALVEHSLVQPRMNAEGEPRFGLLETLREHALERLESSGEAVAVRRRHALAFMRIAEEAEPHLVYADRDPWLRLIDLELDNFRAVLAWGCTPDGEAELALLTLGSMSWFWYLRGRLQEGRMWSERLLGTAQTVSTAARARTLYTLGGIALMMQGLAPLARASLDQSAVFFRVGGDRRRLAHALTLGGLAATSQRDLADALEMYRQALELARANGDVWLEALALASNGAARELSGELGAAEELYRSSLRLFEQVDDKWGRALALRELGSLAVGSGEFGMAREVYAQSVALFREASDARGLAQALLGLGRATLQAGAAEDAYGVFIEALERWRELGLRVGIVRNLAGLAGVAASLGQWERSARLYGAASDAASDAALGVLAEQLGESAFDAAWSAGRAMTLEEAVAYALAAPTGAPRT